MNDPKPDDKPPADPPLPAPEATSPVPAPVEPASVESPLAESSSTAAAVPEPQPAAPAPIAAPKPDDSEPPWLPPPESRRSRNAGAFKELMPTRSCLTGGGLMALLILVPVALVIFLWVVCAVG